MNPCVTLFLLLGTLFFASAGNAQAGLHPNHESSPVYSLGLTPQTGFGRMKAVFDCPCPEATLTLASAECRCEEAEVDRARLRSLLEKETSETVDERVIEATLDAIEEFPRLRRLLKYPQSPFDSLWDTVRSVCPAELLKVYRIGPISCRIRGIWNLRFKTLLAYGMSEDAVFQHYVQEVNHGLPEDEQYSAQALLYRPAGNTTVSLPFFVAGVVALLIWGIRAHLRRTRRTILPEGEAEASKGPHLTEAEEALLREELEDSLEL